MSTKTELAKLHHNTHLLTELLHDTLRPYDTRLSGAPTLLQNTTLRHLWHMATAIEHTLKQLYDTTPE